MNALPYGRPSSDLFLSNDSASIEERTPTSITSLLERAEASLQRMLIPIRKEEDWILLSKYSTLGLTVRLKKTKENCQAPQRAKTFEFNDEVEELSLMILYKDGSFQSEGRTSLDSSLTPATKDVGWRLTRSSTQECYESVVKIEKRKEKKKWLRPEYRSTFTISALIKLFLGNPGNFENYAFKNLKN